MAAPTPQQRSLLERVRQLIDAEPDVREVSMFGGRAIMLGSTMVVSVGKDGSLLVRADADDRLVFWVNTAMTYNRVITSLRS